MKHGLRRSQDVHDQPVDEPTDLWDRQRDQGVVRCELRHERPPLSVLPGTCARTTAK